MIDRPISLQVKGDALLLQIDKYKQSHRNTETKLFQFLVALCSLQTRDTLIVCIQWAGNICNGATFHIIAYAFIHLVWPHNYLAAETIYFTMYCDRERLYFNLLLAGLHTLFSTVTHYCSALVGMPKLFDGTKTVYYFAFSFVQLSMLAVNRPSLLWGLGFTGMRETAGGD